MKTIASFKRGIGEVKRAWRGGRFDRAYDVVTRLLKDWPDNPQLLTLRGCLLQLHDADSSLEDIRETLRRAVDLDGESPEAWKELGHFLTAIDDDVPSATKCFAKTIKLCKRLLSETLVAQGQALSELGRREEALGCFAEAYWLQSHNGKAAEGATEIFDRLKDLARIE